MEELQGEQIQRWKGIRVFINAFSGTIPLGVELTLWEDATFGYAICG